MLHVLEQPDDDALAGEALASVQSLRTTYLAMVDAVAGDDGLSRVACLAARTIGAEVAIVVPKLGAPVLSRPVLGTGDRIALRTHANDWVHQRRSRTPDGVLQAVPIRSAESVFGLVALLGVPLRTSFEAATEMLHLTASVAVTKVALESTRTEVESSLRDTFMEELRSTLPLSANDIVRRASRFGCDLTAGVVVLCAAADSDRPRMMMTTITDAFPGALTQVMEGRLYAVVSALGSDAPAEPTLARAQMVADRLRQFGPVGVSSFYADPGELRRALSEAELIVDVLSRSGAPPEHVVTSGNYRLLLRLFVTHPEVVWEFYESTVGPIVAYDEQYGMDLVQTLDTYLAHDCNMNATAAAAFAHRHTVAYRLERIRQMTQLDPTRTDDRERLGLGMKAYRILSPSRERETTGPEKGATRRRAGREA
jgi:PucR family transcriptional regulator, purine catabolism regulatory protein